jgi:hypothetical protein
VATNEADRTDDRDLTRRLTTELGAFEARPRAGADVSTEDLRVTFQRYRSFFDRLLAA